MSLLMVVVVNEKYFYGLLTSYFYRKNIFFLWNTAMTNNEKNLVAFNNLSSIYLPTDKSCHNLFMTYFALFYSSKGCCMFRDRNEANKILFTY